MRLSLSTRAAEAPTKDRLLCSFEQFCGMAHHAGYEAICLRASAGGVQTPLDELRRMRKVADEHGLAVSMATTDYDVPLNNDRGPNNLRKIGPHLDVAGALGTTLIRVCLKQEDDIAAAARAADEARERGIRLAHQCHTNSLFEEVEGQLAVLARICRANFGLIYEPANLLLCGQSYGRETLKRLAPHIMNVYLQNHRLGPDGESKLPTRVRGEVSYFDIPLWQSGGIDFDEVFAGLRTIGYDGTITVHQSGAARSTPEDTATKSADFLRRYVS
ncbi:MAG: sugar phosphate isomerase/epimerase [Pirellulales bacterium]|nr:sugar phosphate isomerase/epimerase [Pirellulales bacterium]